ncbi:MAG: AraC family transcriptional regulator [Betaproteobacteria bacterium]|nr:AraC family transcriptional regulator [Betaproteobacteria bacterium]MDE2047121.1 AraC family transcriptional regulator [Betaproteobacteria bacterium]
MNPVAKAAWYVEAHLAEPIALDDIARAACVSRFHLARAFAASAGTGVLAYARARRLTLAAHALAGGAPDILAVAVQAGYRSHEAFTRAFREQFGQTPEQVRALRDTATLDLTEPLKMDEQLLETVAPPRFVDGVPLLIVGLAQRYAGNTNGAMPAQWQRFAPHIGHVPGQKGGVAYGVLCNGDDDGSIEYVCGVEVTHFAAALPAGLSAVRVPAQRYAVFRHDGHIAGIRRTWHTLWVRAVPQAGLTVTDGPAFERYGETFNPQTGLGDVEIWLPLAA